MCKRFKEAIDIFFAIPLRAVSSVAKVAGWNSGLFEYSRNRRARAIPLLSQRLYRDVPRIVPRYTF